MDNKQHDLHSLSLKRSNIHFILKKKKERMRHLGKPRALKIINPQITFIQAKIKQPDRYF